MGLTTDPNDPRLGHGADSEATGMNEAYLVLSEEERAKGFVRPVRHSYIHVGPPGPQYVLRDLTAEEQERYADYNYVKYEEYPPSDSSVVGSFWTQERIDKIGRGCGVETQMATALAETYARDPSFYGATFCVGCQKHLPVNEFVWGVPSNGTDERVGS